MEKFKEKSGTFGMLGLGACPSIRKSPSPAE
jgi:hypothetical protein